MELQELASKLEIHELPANYSFAVDERDWPLLRRLFTDDAQWLTSYASAASADELIQLLDRLVPAPGQGPKRRHLVSNIVVTLHGDTASAKSNYVIFREADGGIVPSVVGSYLDDLCREEGRWKFRKRQIIHGIAGDLGLRAAPAAS